MKVPSVTPSDPVLDVAKTAPKQEKVAQPKVSQKKDSVVISEKAKDLAALKAGKSAQEEAGESLAAKEREKEV